MGDSDRSSLRARDVPALPQRLAELLALGFVEVAEYAAPAVQRPQVTPFIDVGEAIAPGEEPTHDVQLGVG